MITMYELLNGQRCQFNNRHAAILGAVYTVIMFGVVVSVWGCHSNLVLRCSGCCVSLTLLWNVVALYERASISILVVLLYSWRVGLNTGDSNLGEVYYGVQIAIMANIFIQLLLIVLSLCLFIGIIKERPGLIIPWIIGLITFMALEAVCIVYSNVLRDHINKQFDALCRAEVAFFIARGILNVLALVGVVKYYQDLLCGISWKEPEAIEV